VSEVLDRGESLVFDVASAGGRHHDAARELLGATLDHLEQLFSRSESVTGLAPATPTWTSSWPACSPPTLVVVGARPGHGEDRRSPSAWSPTRVKLKKPCSSSRLEMSHMELTQRLLSSEARGRCRAHAHGKLREADWPKIGNAISRMSEAPIYIDDNPNLTVMDIRAAPPAPERAARG